MRGGLILDRDGVLIESMPPGQYLSRPSDIRWVPGSRDALRYLAEGVRIYPVVVVTNQAGLSRGTLKWDEVLAVNSRFFFQSAPWVNGYYLCPHAPEDRCDCRKPKPGLVLRAAASHTFDPARSMVVGDFVSDMELAEAIGAEYIMVRTGRGRDGDEAPRAAGHPVCDDLAAAVPLIEEWWIRQGA